MQRYSPITDATPAMRENSQDGSWYWCQDVDDRIAALERALKSCRVVLVAELKAQRSFQRIAEESVAEADKALALMETGSHG